eukprot:4094913-Prymnesium_polylepis.1
MGGWARNGGAAWVGGRGKVGVGWLGVGRLAGARRARIRVEAAVACSTGQNPAAAARGAHNSGGVRYGPKTQQRRRVRVHLDFWAATSRWSSRRARPGR